MNYIDRITCDPEIKLGKPVITGTRITLELILRKISEGMTTDELLAAYPNLSKEDILAAVSYSADGPGEELAGRAGRGTDAYSVRKNGG